MKIEGRVKLIIAPKGTIAVMMVVLIPLSLFENQIAASLPGAMETANENPPSEQPNKANQIEVSINTRSHAPTRNSNIAV